MRFLQTPKGYCGAYTEDARVAIRHVRNVIGVRRRTIPTTCLLPPPLFNCACLSHHQPLGSGLQNEAPLIALGYSLGANIMLKYVGEGTGYVYNPCPTVRGLLILSACAEGENVPLNGAISVSNPLDFKVNSTFNA